MRSHLLFWLLLAIRNASGEASTGEAGTKEYDFVVIGGGTAGLAVAARLSENPSTTVAVIEAGIHQVNEPLVDTPALFGQGIGNPALDWKFVSVPQPSLNNGVVGQPRGKMLGGSSGLNFMVWDRASKDEYDAWHELGATGWNWTTLLPYMKKSETVSPPEPVAIFPGATPIPVSTFDKVHGHSGPIQPSYNVLYSNVTDPYVETINSLGIPTLSDPYSGHAAGLYNSQLSVDRVKDVGRRSYAANTYFNLSMDRPNFHLFTSTQATKIMFSNAASSSRSLVADRVSVVALNDTGFSGVLGARKGVILAAGAFQTPQLLELSGIGNKTILSAAGVKTLIDLPGVGENLQDHAFLKQDFQLQDVFFTFDEIRNNATFLAEQTEEYAVNHTGFFAARGSTVAFPPLLSTASEDAFERIRQEAVALASAPGLSPLTKAQYKIQLDWLQRNDIGHTEIIMNPSGGLTDVAPSPNTSYVTLETALVHPFSRGTVHINSSDPLAPPLIDPQYVSNAVDTEAILAGMKFVQKIAQSPPLGLFIVTPHEPAANVTSDEDLLAFMRRTLASVFHPAGTAAMVPRDVGGVVDPTTLKVYDTANLYVVDASLVPLQVATHLQATIYAIAERASDIIKEGCQ